MPPKVVILYSTHPGAEPDGSDILFLSRMRNIADAYTNGQQVDLQLYLTGSSQAPAGDLSRMPSGTKTRRATHEDLEAAVGQVSQRASSVCYICGPQKMTDDFVDHVQGLKGMDPHNVLCEKWW